MIILLNVEMVLFFRWVHVLLFFMYMCFNMLMCVVVLVNVVMTGWPHLGACPLLSRYYGCSKILTMSLCSARSTLETYNGTFGPC